MADRARHARCATQWHLRPPRRAHVWCLKLVRALRACVKSMRLMGLGCAQPQSATRTVQLDYQSFSCDAWILFAWSVSAHHAHVHGARVSRARPHCALAISYTTCLDLQVLIACKYCTKRTAGCGDVHWHLILSPHGSHTSVRSSPGLSDSRHDSNVPSGQDLCFVQ